MLEIIICQIKRFWYTRAAVESARGASTIRASSSGG